MVTLCILDSLLVSPGIFIMLFSNHLGFSLIEKEKKRLCSQIAGKVENNTMKIQGKPKKESPKNVAIKYLLLLNMKLMAEKARRRREWHLEFKRFRLCMM